MNKKVQGLTMIKKVYLHGVGVNHDQEGAGGLAMIKKVYLPVPPTMKCVWCWSAPVVF